MYDMLIQGIGLIAFALFLLSYQVRSNRGLFAMQTLGNLLFALQFFLLGGVGGAVGSLISCFRNSLLLSSKKYPNKNSDLRNGGYLRRAGRFLFRIFLLSLFDFSY